MNCRTAGRVAPLLVVIVLVIVGSSRAEAVGLQAQASQSDYIYTPADTLAAIDDVSATSGVAWGRLYAIVDCETAHTLDPYAIGRAGEKGAVQLHPRGELPRFFDYGYDNPFSPYQAVAFLAQRLNEGGARAWTCA